MAIRAIFIETCLKRDAHFHLFSAGGAGVHMDADGLQIEFHSFLWGEEPGVFLYLLCRHLAEGLFSAFRASAALAEYLLA